MSQLSSHDADSLAPRHRLDEERHHTTASRHEGRLREAIERDRRLQAMYLLVVDAVHHIDRPHHQEEDRRLEGMEGDPIQGIVTWIPTGRAHILDRGPDRGRIPLGRGVVLRFEEVRCIDDVIVRLHQGEEEAGEGGVRVILAFRVTVIEVVVGVEVGIEGDRLGKA